MTKRKRTVNSASPAHRRLIARQKAARARPSKSGKIKEGFYDSKGVWRKNPVRKTADGKTSYSAANMVEIETRTGTKVVVTAREAMKMMTAGKVRIQMLEAL